MQHFEQSETLKRLPKQFFAGLVQKVQHMVNQGYDVINLGQGNPDLPTPQHIVEELKVAVDNSQYHKYSPFRGQEFFKEAIASFYKREFDVDIDPSTEVAILFGTKAGLVEISQCLLNPGDIALMPDPGYPDYMSGIALANAKPVFMPLQEENNFLPDYEALNQDQLDQAKLMFLNYPNNPTAATASEEFFDETIAVAKKHDICVLHDFAYGAIGFDGEKPQSFLQSEGAKDVGIEMYTLSKTYNMAGWRAGFAVGNPSVIESLNLIQDHMFMSLFGAVQQAATKALLADQSEVEKLVSIYEERRNVIIEKLNEIGWHVKAPKGSFFVWLAVPRGFTSEEFADLLLEKAHVAVAPGNGFGEMGEGYVRIGLLAEPDRLKEAAERIGKLEVFQNHDI
ncbi:MULTISPECIES: pyridoxal phosphate-dependent aminotransferase [Paraliobacillus]|uniref:pyridoxal phosphate-dependent aminotransferase n=1 Tax=Paraliobacillus TaxID=200903 RepID=UPI000E3E62BE|nr:MULTISPECIES: pyridoxal phosphate-dependent aminotransferase [Paraliobacillus]